MKVYRTGPGPTGRPGRLERMAEMVLDAWLRDWAVEPDTIASEASVSVGAGWTDFPEDSRVLGTGEDLVAYAVGADASRALGHSLARIEPVDDDAIAIEVGTCATEDLVERIAGLKQVMHVPTDGRGLEALGSGGNSPTLSLSLVVSGCRIAMGFSVAALTRLDPLPRSATSVTLSPRGEAVLNQPATMEVELDLGEVELAMLRDLTPGEIISTRTPLSATFNLRTGGRALPNNSCRLARMESTRAVLIESGE